MKQKGITIISASIAILITFLLILFPEQSLEASIRGLHIWWEVVFPSLLPFFITAELLIGFGVVTFIGVLFEPIMRPLFNVPGVGSFAWIMGMASGYPSGAKISVRLHEEGAITKTEAERLVSFTNSSSPLFIFGAISIGFFHDPSLGLLIAASHYIGNALVGICMRFYGQTPKINKKVTNHTRTSYLKRAFRMMHRTRLKDHRPLGELVGDAILSSITTLVIVGGFIILFSVLNKLLFLIGITAILSSGIDYILQLLTLPTELSIPFISGLFEITLGAQLISQINLDSILPKVIIVSFILGFNGFSVQAQVLSIISKTDIRFKPYFIARILHGTIASILTVLLYKPLYWSKKTLQHDDIPVIQDSVQSYWISLLEILKQAGPLITLISLLSATLILYYRKNKTS